MTAIDREKGTIYNKGDRENPAAFIIFSEERMIFYEIIP